MNSPTPICMAEEYWANSPLSIARHYGRIQAYGNTYIIVNKEGKDIFECSAEAEKAGRDMAIEPGEPCDLLRSDFVAPYRRLGRDRFLAVLKEHRQASETELKKIFKEIKLSKRIKKINPLKHYYYGSKMRYARRTFQLRTRLPAVQV